MSDAALQIQAKIIGDPRLVSCAKLLDIPPAFLLGPLLHLMCKALDYAEDGDLWRGDEDSTIRFIAASAAWPGDTVLFVSALQQEGWLNEWMIADWLHYAGDYLYRKYKSSNRNRLIEIHAKNGREYGKRRGGNSPTTSHQHPQGCNRDGDGLKKNHPLTHNPITLIPTTLNAPEKKDPPTTPSPLAHENEETKNPGVAAGKREEKRPLHIVKVGEGDFLKLSPEGLLDQGIALSLDQLDCSGLTFLEVFSAFKPVLVFHSIATLNSFYYRCTRCKSTPAWWTMVLMDKVHAVYRIRPDSTTWLEQGADPVALTMAALLPSYGRRHTPTESARQLFLEIMIDYQRQKDGQASRWASCITGNFIAKELDLRKGRAGKIA